MTKTFTVCCAFVLSTIATSSQADLVSYWTFDDGDRSGTSLIDTVGTNDGTMLNTPSVISGVSGQALKFNGSNQYVNIPHSSSLNIGAPTDSLTVGTWVNTSYTSGAWFRALAAKYGYSSQTASWGLGWTTTDKLGFYVRDSGSTAVLTATPNTFQGIDGQWHHVLGVRDANADTVRFYLDGQNVSTLADTTNDIRNTQPVSFARHGGSYVPASLDETAIWDNTLTDLDIRQLAGGTKPSNILRGASYKQRVLTDDPVSYWRFNNKESQVLDKAGTHDGTYHEGDRLSQGMAVSNLLNTAANFDGSNDWIGIDSSFAGASGEFSSYSVELWFNPDVVSGSRDLFAATKVGDNHAILIEGTGSGTIRYLHRPSGGTSGGTNIYSDNTFDASDNWYHIVATFDSDSDLMQLYWNGELDKQVTGVTSDILFDMNVAMGRLAINNSARYYDGLLDEVAFYNYALLPETIAAHYRTGLGVLIPEPSTALLGTIGLLGLLGLRVRRRRRRA